MAQLLHVLALFTDHRETKSSEASLGRMNPTPCSSYKSKKGKGKENAQSPVTQPLSSRKFQCVPNVHGCKGGSFCVVCIESSPPESSKGILGEPRGTLSLTVAVGINLRQKVSARLFAWFNSISLLVQELEGAL